MMINSNGWLILLTVILGSALVIWAYTSIQESFRESENLKINKSNNESILSGQLKGNVRWNATFGNLTTITELVELLHNRTPLFKDIVQNEKTIIQNQYEFARQLNVENVSNITKVSNLTK